MAALPTTSSSGVYRGEGAVSDVAVSIKKNWEDNNTRFRAHVTITQTGNAPSPTGMIVKVKL